MNMVSIIIPARNEIYLQKTIESVLSSARGEIEVIAICDGYWPDPPIQDDDRVVIIHHTKPTGQRQSINEAARIAKGKFIMKLDAHCALDEGFDIKLAADCEYDWTVIPRMYNLDKDTWLPKLHKRTDYMYIGWNEKKELRSLYYNGSDWKYWHSKPDEIDDTMGCMGPCFFMHKDRFWELGGCDEDHGSWGQQGIEVALKAWLSGGRLVVNKKTWFAHWFRGDVGFPYQITGKEVAIARKHSMDLWLNNKWEKQTRQLSWVLDKFNPPGWEEYKVANMTDKQIEVNNFLYNHLHKKRHHPKWKGIPILKMPSDMFLYHRVLWECRPELIVETGTKFGGSSLFFQDNLDMIGQGGKVVTVDIYPEQVEQRDERITYLAGDSISREIVRQIKEMAKDKATMVILDGDHRRSKVKWELHHYAPLVTPGQYLVLEDCYANGGHLYDPGEARDWFLERNKDFEQTNLCQEFLVGFNLGGWLRRIK